MARSGVYKFDVQRERDALIAQGVRPTVDAVRAALGHTGSKTTIHKYLKELEAEDGGNRRPSVSDVLQDLIERLAARLHQEADEQVATMREQFAATARQQADALAAAQKDNAQLRTRLQEAETALRHEQEAHANTRDALLTETLAARTAAQQVADLQAHLQDKDQQCKSMKEERDQARDALAHYQRSVAEQRRQEQARHDQQVQALTVQLNAEQQANVVHLAEISRLKGEGDRLIKEIGHARGALYDAQERERRTTGKLDELKHIEQRNGALAAQLADRDAQLRTLQEQLAAQAAHSSELTARLREQELAAAQWQSKFDAQQAIFGQWQTVFDRLPPAPR